MLITNLEENIKNNNIWKQSTIKQILFQSLMQIIQEWI